MEPAVVIRPILPGEVSVNQSAPSGPAVIAMGRVLPPVAHPGHGMLYSVTVPAVVILPTLFPSRSTNHTAPSGPEARAKGPLPGVGTAKSTKPGGTAGGGN